MNRMRSPEHRAGQRAARRLEEELSLKYLSPGAFTILSPHEYATNPDPPAAPTQYRLTPTSTRRRIQAFSIIAEASSNPGSRSPSPTGRVSPFRGRGFNPIGSRHASPNPSPPPPEEPRAYQPNRTHTNNNTSSSSPRRSQIPQPTRKGSASNIFGDQVTQEKGRSNSSKLSPQFSQSMTNISRKGRNRKPAFEQLSPITGSSPETTSIGKKSQSSPSRIPMSSRSQPASRRSSPSRGRSPYSNQSSRQNSRAGSRSTSRNNSRDPSPTKGYSRIPVKNAYKEVSAKVNTFNKTKPKVPPKPQELRNGSSGNSSGSGNKGSNNKGRLSRKSSEVKLKASGSGTNLTGHSRGGDKEDARSDQQPQEADGSRRNGSQKSNSSSKSSQTIKTGDGNGTKLVKDQNIDEITILEKGAPKEPEEDTKKPELQSRGSNSKLDTTVVSSTTKTAVQPLKMDEDLENSLREERSKAGYLSEDRILSATSVSNAMNKMNDSVLNSQTLLGDQNFGKRSPANTIISMSNDNTMGNKVRSAATTLPTIESIHKQLDGVGQNINSTFSDSNKVHMESIENTVKNNITKANTPDHVRGYVQKSVNDRIIDARTLVTSDVKPIKILVKGRPSDIEVQSGNTRLPSSATNGLSGSPRMTYIYVMPLPETYNGYGLVENGGLPPAEPHQNATNQHEEVPPSKTTCCSRLFSRCKCKKPLCKKWKKKKITGNDIQPIKKSKSSMSCFNCRKKKKQDEDKASTSTAPVEGNEPTNQKASCWNRLKCCKSKRVGDTGCCPRSKRKDSWVDNREGIRTDAEPSKPSCKSRCKNTFRNIFCCACCVRKKKVEVEVRRESMISSKKKSLTPTAVPPVDTRPKIDISLVEHSSVMKGAIPVLPVPMAWICLICNIFLPGIGTVLSGMFCLCVGKPRFSQNDGPRPRIGAFIIDLIIGCGQLFTVLFCLVGWGWSIWWGVIMLKAAKKHKRIKLVEARAQGQVPVAADNHRARDAERGS